MPSWKKVIISGSDAALNSLDITGDLTVDTNTLYVDSADNRVGIGTLTPSRALDVNGEIQNNGIFRKSGNVLIKSTGTETLIGPGGSGVVSFHNSSTMTTADETVRIDSSGDVGIGETSVDARLHITSAGAAVNQKFELNGVAAWRVGIPNSQTYFAFDNSTDALTSPKVIIDSSGNVGIGTTSPSEKLDVNGNASISGSLTVSQGGNFTMDGGGTLDTGGGTINTTGGSINTNGGNINLGIGALNGTIPGSAVNVDTVTATVKNFVIDHPSEEKAGYKLRHSSLEGPEIGVYFRGKSTETIIDLPDYWKDLVDEDSITVNLTPFGSPCQHYIEDIRDNQVIIGCACGTPNYHFTVYGERKDVEKLVVEYKEEKYL